jgi:hypothetical protein
MIYRGHTGRMKKVISALALGVSLVAASAGAVSASPETSLASWYRTWWNQASAYMLETIEGLKYDEFTGDYTTFDRVCQHVLLPQALSDGVKPPPAVSVHGPWTHVLNAITTIGENSTKNGEGYFSFQGKYGFWYELDVIQVNLQAMDAASKALGVTPPPLND